MNSENLDQNKSIPVENKAIETAPGVSNSDINKENPSENINNNNNKSYNNNVMNLKMIKTFSEDKLENNKENEFDLNSNNNLQENNEKDEYIGLAYKSSSSDNNIIPDRKSDFKNSLNSNHKLNSKWLFWYISRKEKDHKIPYSQRLKRIAEFITLEEFFKYYMFIKSPSDMERNTDLSLFKEGFQPLWESCPNGGCWFIRFKKSDDQNEIDLKWEKLIFSLIGNFFNQMLLKT